MHSSYALNAYIDYLPIFSREKTSLKRSSFSLYYTAKYKAAPIRAIKAKEAKLIFNVSDMNKKYALSALFKIVNLEYLISIF